MNIVLVISQYIKGKERRRDLFLLSAKMELEVVNNLKPNKLMKEDWKERLIVEQKELKEKLVKLVQFINSEKFYELSLNNKQLLKNQKIAMELYLNVLNMRVFEDVDKIGVPDYRMMLGVIEI